MPNERRFADDPPHNLRLLYRSLSGIMVLLQPKAFSHWQTRYTGHHVPDWLKLEPQAQSCDGASVAVITVNCFHHLLYTYVTK
jgi:hypothetical protein